MKDILNYSTNGLEMQSERAGWWDKDREREERTEQFTKWSMGHTTDIVVALSKARGGRTGEERRGEEGRGGRRKVGERGGGAIRGDEMVIGPSWLSLKANNHSHNHTTHLEIKMCVWWCPWMCVCVCVWSILFATRLSITVSAASSKDSWMVSLSFQHVSVCVCVHVCAHAREYLPLSITSHTFLFTSYSVCEVKWTFTLRKNEPWETAAQESEATKAHASIHFTDKVHESRVRCLNLTH